MAEKLQRTDITIPLAGMDRLKDLSDGIFAFAMTLLILGIDIPKLPKEVTNTELLKHLALQWREIATYVISFLNIGNYWILHHTIFAYLAYTNRTLAQLNLIFLLTVTFLPYPTVLQGEYGRQSIVALVYGITITINYALLLIVAWYAYSKPELIDPEFHLPMKRALVLRLLLPLSLAIAGTVLAFFLVRLSFLFFLLVPLSNAIPIRWIIPAEK
jgi:uncharacterized membrane protein